MPVWIHMANVRTCLFTSQLGLPGHFWSLESLMCARITRLMQINSKKIRLPCWHKIRLLHDAFRGTIGSQTQLRKSASKRKRYQDRYYGISKGFKRNHAWVLPPSCSQKLLCYYPTSVWHIRRAPWGEAHFDCDVVLRFSLPPFDVALQTSMFVVAFHA